MSSRADKILDLEDAVQRVRAAQSRGRAVVMCHGCFDLVHPGHVRHLQHAARQCDHLLVSITGDAGVNKGAGRPLIPQELRAESLAALDCVDWVVINPEATAVSLLNRIRPDVYVKGREYEHNADPRFLAERNVVTAYGGRVVFSSGDIVFSSSALISMLEASADPFQSAIRALLAQHEMEIDALQSIIGRFRNRRVLVIGQPIRDTYVLCDQPHVAGESPMMTLRPLEHRHFDGGASIIAINLAEMGARPTLLTAMPRTTESQALRQRLEAAGVIVHSVDVDQPMIEKQRYLVGTKKLVKIDLGEPITMDADRQDEFLNMAEALAGGQDAAIISDFGLGLFTATMLERLCRAIRPDVPLLMGDVSGPRSNLMAMRQADVLCPSESELRSAMNDYDDSVSAVAVGLLRRTNSRHAMISIGADGVIVFDGSEPMQDAGGASRLPSTHIPSFAGHAVDELGCGDALLAASTLSLCAGTSLPVAGVVGSIAAAAQARRLGNAAVGTADLRRGIAQLAEAHLKCESAPLAQIVI